MPESAEEQTVAEVNQSADYEPAWHLLGSGSPGMEKALVRAFQRLVRQTIAVLGRTFDYPDQAVDVWLDSIRKESTHPDARFMSFCILLSAQHCDEYITRFVERGDQAAEKQMRDRKKEFLRMSGDVSAGRRLDQMGACPPAWWVIEEGPPVSQVATGGRSDTEPVAAGPAPIRKRRGQDPLMDHHRKIAGIVEAHDKDWRARPNWRHDEILTRICKNLDEEKIDVLISWTLGKPEALKGVTVNSWTEAFCFSKKLVADQIASSLKMVRREQ